MNTYSDGHQFSTSNTVINQLSTGSALEVVGQGEVEIVSQPLTQNTGNEGDRIYTTHGYGTVVRLTNVRNMVGVNASLLKDGEVFYVADHSSVVLRASLNNGTWGGASWSLLITGHIHVSFSTLS
mgnify:CR=1 FL=1